MRTLRLLVLTFLIPFIALSQIPSDKAIIADFARRLVPDTSLQKIYISNEERIYLAAVDSPELLLKPNPLFTVARLLSPIHAVIRVTSIEKFREIAQQFRFVLPANDSWKLSPLLLQALKTSNGKLRMLVAASDQAVFGTGMSYPIDVIKRYHNSMLIEASPGQVYQLIKSDTVLFADLADRNQREELIVSGFDHGTNKINMAFHYFPHVTGEGISASVKENRFDTSDIDLRGRSFVDAFSSAVTSGHASIMATMLGGAGNSFYEGKGVAWSSKMYSTNFTNLLPEPDSYYTARSISVQNHSYGTGIENFYGADAAAYDALAVNQPSLVQVFSSGNSGQAAGTGPYSGINGFANITGSFKMAKNNIVVGAVDSIGKIETASSRGPAYDGRIKPELAAFGQDGSSGAAAIVSGISVLLQDAYRQQFSSYPPAALVKAILLNTADDIGNPGPDYSSGFGNANAYKAINAISQARFFSGASTQAYEQVYHLPVPPGMQSLKILLAWTDAAANANSVRALVNDLDLTVVHKPSGQLWHPWILSRYPSRDSLSANSFRGRDSINNVEQVTIELPEPGDYEIRVDGRRVNGSQPFFISWYTDNVNGFSWNYPMREDPVTGGVANMIRWESGYTAGVKGKLEYRPSTSATWLLLNDNVELEKKYFRWIAPDSFTTALLRMTIASNEHITDTFVLSKPLATQVGYNCTDSFLFYWNRPLAINSFRIFRLNGQLLQPQVITTDTFYKTAVDASFRHYSVAPLVNGREGVRSYTFDRNTQGVGCYFRSFLAALLQNQALLQWQLGTTSNIRNMSVQKYSGGSFTTIHSIDNPSSLQYSFNDVGLKQGINVYRIALQLDDGRIVYSKAETIYFTGDIDYVIYPNPVRQGQRFTILQRQPDELHLLIIDMNGRKVKEELLSDITNPVSTAALTAGVYQLVIIKEGKTIDRMKLVVH